MATMHTSSTAQTATTENSAEARLAAAIERSARFRLLYDGRVIATFARRADAQLFADELDDLDRAHGRATASCVVADADGRRLDGYRIEGGELELM